MKKLTNSQLGVYLECMNDPSALIYNIDMTLKLPEGTDLERFKEAVKKVISAHPSIMVNIDTSEGIPQLKQNNYEIIIDDVTADDAVEEIRRLSGPFDLENEPLFRLEIIRAKDGNYFAMAVHHLVSDGSSVKLIADEIATAYDGNEIPKEEYSIFNYSDDEQIIAGTERYELAEAFFKEKLEGTECDLKPASDVLDETDFGVKSDAYATPIIGKFTTKDVEKFTKEHNISENALFTGAFAYALAKFSGESETFFCAGNTGRNKKNARTLGMFVKTLPMHFYIDENDNIEDFLKYTYDYYYKTKVNSIVPFTDLAAKYGATTDVSFVFQSNLLEGTKLAGQTMPMDIVYPTELNLDWDVMMKKFSDSYKIVSHYRKAVYTEGLVKSFCNLFINVIYGMLTKNTLGEIELAGADEMKEYAKINNTEADYDNDRTVIDLFRAQAKKTPDNICVVFNEKKYTYREIDEITDILAKNLVSEGVTSEKVVGVLIPRNEFMAIASLGVLKAGGAYLPLDPTYPPERLNLMMSDSGAMILIYDKSLDNIIDDTFKGKRISTDEIKDFKDNGINLPTPKPTDLFLMLYTSGSTGLPKGVMFEHSNTMVTTEWVKKYYNINENSRVTAYASYGFDAHAYDMYPAITSGAELHVISDEIRLDFNALREYFNKNGITHTVMTMQVGRQFALMGGLTSLKHLSVAGEKLTPLAPPEGINFYNLYGPTEASIIISAFKMDKKYADVPIGYAVENLKTYVVDKRGKLLPIGAVGELVIAGPHVTRGYLNRPEKTAEVYGENTFENVPGYERTYKTGDIVRISADGNVQFVGRRDAQVKVRGFRVELTEVEEIIRRFDGVKDATVAAFDAPAGGKFLAAYIVSDDKTDSAKLAAFIKSEKPPYMVPQVILNVDKIPLNQNGKVNKKALPLPEFKAEDITLPENDTQKKIFAIISEIIGHESFGIDTDLFDAGLNSIGSIKLNVALGEEFDVALKIKDIKDNETIRKLEAFLNSANKETAHEKSEDYPLTESMRGVLMECLSNPNTTAYNIPLLLKISKNIDVKKLAEAVKKAVDAHYFLKTTLFSDKNGDIRAKRNDDEPVTADIIKHEPDLKNLIRPFEILGGKLIRIEIYEGTEDNYLFIDSHHIISDGTSENILINDVNRAYNGEIIQAETYSGFDAALDEEVRRKSDAYDKAKAHYDKLLAGLDSDSLPPKAPEDGGKTTAAHVIKECDNVYENVKQYCAENGLTLNAFFNTAFGFVLSRFDYKEDVVYTTVYNGRNDSRLTDTTAMLVNTLPVVLNTDGAISVKTAIKNLGANLLESMVNDVYSFAEISRAYGLNADLIFVYQGEDFTFDTLCGEKSELIALESENAKAPISLSVYIKNGKIVADAEYDQSLYSGKFISSFIDSYFAAVKGFMDNDNFGSISLMTDSAEEYYRIMNDNDVPLRDVTALDIIEEKVNENPEKTAVIANGESITYRELSDLSDKIAAGLLNKGVTKNTIIGMILDRSKEVYIGEIGIMKSGCAFLPMLPSYPDDRIDFCLRNAESPIVVTTEAILHEKADLFSAEKPYRAVTMESLLETHYNEYILPKLSQNDLAYCIYTSGSTGTPKGVMIKHSNLSNFAQTHIKTLNFMKNPEIEGGALSLSSISFDMCIYEIMLPLCAGKTAVMATEDEIHNPMALIELLRSANVRMITCTPTFMTNMIGIPEFAERIGNLISITVGAEAFPPTLYDTLKKASPELQIVNGYGPTECTMCCSTKELTGNTAITIGRPTGNAKFFVCDKFGNVLPPFAAGELIICGNVVGGGYVKLPDKNKASFFTLRNYPAYHSGDLVRLNGDSEIAFTGRVDNQVKLRGFRVELDEIEKVMTTYEGIKQSKVLVRNNGTEDYLVGFFTADRAIDVDKLTEHLKSSLTYYMVPAVLMQIDKMPLTANGKIDKKGFPEVQKTAKKREKKAAKKSLEQRLCEVFADVLSLDEVYADDNFFELGGTSISASKVTMVLMSEGIDVKYGDIFDNPTPEDLAGFIESQSKTTEATSQTNEETLSINGQKSRKALEFNTIKYAAEVERKPLGDVLLTGAVGFLGVHILKELLEIETGHIYCLVRKGKFASPEARLKTMLVYYFSDGFEEAFKDRISLVEADITDNNLDEQFKDLKFDTIINCAACVKHFAGDDILDRINVQGLINLIDLCKIRNAKLIQISTVSVPGIHTDETYEKQVKMHENELFVIDDMQNKYAISKYKAELALFDAIENDGLRAKVIRVGNLMGRYSDGEFQVNMETNMFMSGIRGFAVMGKYPISHMTDPMSFSPIDCTARAVVLLSGVNDKFTAFNANSRYGFDEMKIIDACNRNGIKIIAEKDEIYYKEFKEKLGDDSVNAKLNGLAAYDIQGKHAVETDNRFTTNILYRIGFSWPLIDQAYLDRSINSVMTLDYFDLDEEEE